MKRMFGPLVLLLLALFSLHCATSGGTGNTAPPPHAAVK
jgi:hypothetical protein